MIGRALNSDNDIFISNGQFAVVKDGGETVQHVRTRLLFYLGEWFLNATAGTPWFQEILVKPANLPRIESILKSRVIATDGVESLLSFEMNYNNNNRILSVAFEVSTIYGTVTGATVVLNE